VDFEADLPVHLRNLFRFLMDNNKLEDIRDANLSHLNIISDHVLAMIKKGELGWEQYVPQKVGQAIKDRRLFGYSSHPLPAASAS
jgi:hypothetical protein